MTNRTLTTLLALMLLIGTVAPVAAAGGPVGETNANAQIQADSAANESPTNESPVTVTVGQQLSTVMVQTDSEVRSEVDRTSFELRFEDSEESDRGEAIAERAETLAERAIEIREDYREATRAHRSGAISDSEYAQRIAALTARAEDLAESVRELRGRAAAVSALELRTAGFTVAELQAIDEQLAPVTGAGAAALLQRFTGRGDGEIRIETRDGLVIEVESEDGELSREVERPRDDSTDVTVTQVEAFESARTALGSPMEGRWTLRRASVHDDSGYYKFEFVLVGANATGEAEVRVDGSGGDVFRLETEIELPDDEDEHEGDGDEREGGDRDEDRDDGNLVLLVAEGTLRPNATVTLVALAGGEPVSGATVTLNDELVGTTDDDGMLVVTLPAGEVELRATAGDAEGELEVEFDETGTVDAELRKHLDVTASVDGETITVRVSYGGSPVEGATVSVDGRQVGTTGADGRVQFDATVRDELDLEIRKGAFTAEVEFEARGGSLLLVETKFEGDSTDDEERTAEEERVGDDDRTDDDVVEREDEIEDESEDGDGTETDDGSETESDAELAIRIVTGAREPGATVTVEVAADGEPISGAIVLLNDERVGTTDAGGHATLTLPDEGRVEIVAEFGDEDAELEFEFGDDGSGEGRSGSSGDEDDGGAR